VPYDVIVVGGGPAGGTLAGALGQRGLRVLVLEQNDGTVADPRMHHINVRSMEILRAFGLEQAMRECGWPTDHPQDVVFVTKLDGEEIARIAWASNDDMVLPASSPTYAQRCPQAWFNPIATGFARAQPGVEVRHFCRAEVITQSDDGVAVEAVEVDSGKRHVFQARYLVGCDGRRSMVHDLINGSRELPPAMGRSVEIMFRSRRLQEICRFGRNGRYIFIGEDGIGATLMAFDGVDRYRFVLMVQPDPLNEDDMRARLRKIADAEFDIEFLTPVLPWVNRAVSAERYVSARMALVGDAAHGTPPTGGFGLNTGLVDAFELAWRLEALVKGWGGPRLLPAYECERKQGVERSLNMATEIYRDWVHWAGRINQVGHELNASGPAAAELRRRTGRDLAKALRREFNSIGGPLGYRYRSELCIADGSPETRDDILEYVQTARPGHRAPHAWLPGGLSTLDLFGKGFVLLAFAPSASTASWRSVARQRGVPLEVVNIDDPHIAALYEKAFVLVRPDGMVAWRSDSIPDDVDSVLATVTGHGTQAPRTSARERQPAAATDRIE
jgi:2-polyprenyl-6-methoxyphenol hydroxylase-like FAD-dependent oxidoreductase